VLFYTRLGERLAAISGVRASGIGSDLPWTGYDENIDGFTIEGKQPPPHFGFHARYHVASEEYFRALGIPLVRGRFFTEHDDMTTSKRPVILINHAMAEMYWPGEDPVGKRITFDDHPKDEDWFNIVGVVGDVKDRPNSAKADNSIWWPVKQMPWSFIEMSIAVRAESKAADLAGAVRTAVHSIDPLLAVSDLKLMDEVAGKNFSTPRFTLFLVGLFAALAAILAAIGIYGVISYSVTQRTHEFGLRMALGAKPRDVIGQVMGQGVRLAAAGIVIGVAGALALGRVLLTLLYNVSASDPLTFAAVGLAALGIAALACYVPARRATSTDPMTALRAD